MPLGLVSTQVPLISHSTRSAKLLFFQKVIAIVVVIDSRITSQGTVVETNWIIEQTPSPTFCLLCMFQILSYSFNSCETKSQAGSLGSELTKPHPEYKIWKMQDQIQNRNLHLGLSYTMIPTAVLPLHHIYYIPLLFMITKLYASKNCAFMPNISVRKFRWSDGTQVANVKWVMRFIPFITDVKIVLHSSSDWDQMACAEWLGKQQLRLQQ